MDRRTFLKSVGLASGASTLLGTIPELATSKIAESIAPQRGTGSVIISTWDFKLPVNQTAARILENGGSVLDAIEQAIRLVEADPKVTTVGRGGYPDRDGHLTLDASIMDSNGNAGAVVYLEGIMHPISVARLVMEKTQHVILAGDGALQFAVENGLKKQSLLTEDSRKEYQRWLKENHYNPPINKHNHDTIGLLVLDARGSMAGGCSTSGAAWKMHGRVGDSPIIGAGLYVDNEIGAATSTGLGEAVLKISGSFLIVEMMRSGLSPQQACERTVQRLLQKQPKYRDMEGFFVGFVAMNRSGEIGAYCSRKGFQYSLYRDGVNSIHDSDYLLRD